MSQCRSRSRAVLLHTLAVALLLAPAASFAELERVGPTVQSHGFPSWYQDKTGLVLEFCSPLNQAELDGGWCLLLPADTVAPETFPAPFSDEHFYWAGNATVAFTTPADSPIPNLQSSAILVLGLEAAFRVGPVVAGDQVTFGRIRIRVNDLPYDGDYKVFTPFGDYDFPGQLAGQRLFSTEDIGFDCPAGRFDCALGSHVGPFLLPSDAAGGAELPAIAGPVAGKLYIADPARTGPVTGSTYPTFIGSDGVEKNHNIFRIEGPNGWAIETTAFSLMGRVFTGAMPGRVDVQRASYTQAAAGEVRLDVFASAFPTTQGRIPPQTRPAAVQPSLVFYPVACATNANGTLGRPAGVSGVRMLASNTNRWGQGALTAVPPAVCVEDSTARDATGAVVPTFTQHVVTDKITITGATYDPTSGTLTVTATSSDAVDPLTLTLTGYGDLDASGRIDVLSLAAPPASVRVVSFPGLGSDERQVDTLVGSGGGGGPTGSPVAGYDNVAVDEDSGTTNIAVLANDTVDGAPITFGAGVQLAITSPPRLGTAIVKADGTIDYTTSPNRTGVDDVGYVVTVNGVASGAAHVTIVVNPVNDPPVAVGDSTGAVVGVRTTVDVLANDTDVDGLGDVVLANVTTPTPVQLSSFAVVGGLVSFTPTAPGTYSFTYFAQDRAGATSATPATVTVNVTAAETIAIARAEYRANKGRLRVDGTIAPVASQTVTVEVTRNASGVTGTVATFTATSDATGAWALDTAASIDTAGGTLGVRVTGPNGGSAARALAVR